MDLNMPVMDGLRSAQKILSVSSVTTRPKIIAVTAFANDEEMQKCFAVGMSDFKTKPIDSECFKDVLLSYKLN